MKFRHATLAAATGALMMCGAVTAEAADGTPRVTTSDNDRGRFVDLKKETANLTRDMDRKAVAPVHMAGYLLTPRPSR
ncbi:hypothetical protein ACFV0R_05835 [Streptomyces sp. NPDC059578]|uniref:hypothetical protein n=1 Tax=unclassified Streptomyces TaxID=2593676 RepID=UPI00364B56DE